LSVQTTGERSTPDVAFDANSSTGVSIYETSARTGKGAWQIYGGTSLGAPVWAGIIAIADQGRALEGKGSLDGPTQTLPLLYGLRKGDFKNPTPNQGLFGTGGLSSLIGDIFGPDSGRATANIATGLGSPNGGALISGLVDSEVTTSQRVTTAQSANGSVFAYRSLTTVKKTRGRIAVPHSAGHARPAEWRHSTRELSGATYAGAASVSPTDKRQPR
jgi:hypothetical protein